MAVRKEIDLYAPVKQFLAAQGYTVKGEVTGCDLVAVRGEDVVVVELKVRFNLELVLQGVQRQRLTQAVYLAVESPRARRGRWQEILALCRRLGLGLLTVNFGRQPPRLEVELEVDAPEPRQRPRARARLLGEFTRRTGDFNIGGSTRRALVTAYREDALRVAEVLKSGPCKLADLRAATGNSKVAGILQGNAYGWFARVGRGIYELTPAGVEALVTYAAVVAELV